MSQLTARTGGQILVDQLIIHGADLAFCVPGESYLPVLDALYGARERIELITCRHESGAANMAEAYGKLTGTPGICFVTRGPGATNASIGVHTAYQDSTPMILFIGQVGSDFIEREAFQEIDYRRMFGPMAKWVAQIDRTDRIPEFIERAYQVATSGRMGPVVLALPEDMLFGAADVGDARRWQRVESAPTDKAMDRLGAMLRAAQRPFLIVGGSGWSETACADLRRFVEVQALPVGCEFRYQDLFDNAHPSYAGDVGIGINPQLAERIKASDLLISLGARLGEITTGGYGLITAPVPAQRLVHFHPGAEELGRVYHADLMINATMSVATRMLAALPRQTGSKVESTTIAANFDYLQWQQRKEVPGKLQMWDVIQHLDKVLPADAIITNGAGNYTVWVHRFHQLSRLSHAACASIGRDGLRRTRGDRGKSGPSQAHRGQLRRGRLFPHDRAGARDSRAAQAQRRDHRREQRHVRHDPHAPGTGVSRESSRHDAGQPGLRRDTRTHSVPMARSSSPRTSSRRHSSARCRRASPRCSSCASTPRRFHRTRR